MGTIYNGVFSEFEITRMAIKMADEATFTAANCVATFEEELETKVVTKKCRGKNQLTRPRGTGAGTIKATLHIPYALLIKFRGMEDTSLTDGVYAYGENSRHKEFTLTCLVKDEDGNYKVKAYPRCIIQNGIPSKIENEGTEVSESEIEISVMPDTYGYGMYERAIALGTAGADELVESWLTNWSRSLVAAATTTYTITWSLTGCVASVQPENVPSGGRVFTTIVPNTDYTLPSSITVSGTTSYLWNKDTGLLVVDDIKAATSITITATTG